MGSHSTTIKIIVAAIFFLAAVSCSSDRSKDRIKIGDPAPDFTVTDINGKPFHLSSWRGNPVVLRFWSTDCQYCRADTPIFNHFFEKYKERGLVVAYINRGADEELVRGFAEDLDIPFPMIIDADLSISKNYNIRLDPQTIVISPEQKIIAAILGGVSEGEFRSLVGSYFPEKE
jgi:peroxiredoxin